MKCGVNRMFFFGHVKYLRDEIFKRFNHISKEEYKITHSKKKNVCWPTIEIEKENL